jgi:hypothetical protein
MMMMMMMTVMMVMMVVVVDMVAIRYHTTTRPYSAEVLG